MPRALYATPTPAGAPTCRANCNSSWASGCESDAWLSPAHPSSFARLALSAQPVYAENRYAGAGGSDWQELRHPCLSGIANSTMAWEAGDDGISNPAAHTPLHGH